MARPKNTENLVAVTGSVPPELKEALEDYRWSQRKTLSEVIREAVETFIESKGLEVKTPATDEPIPGVDEADAETDAAAGEEPVEAKAASGKRR